MFVVMGILCALMLLFIWSLSLAFWARRIRSLQLEELNEALFGEYETLPRMTPKERGVWVDTFVERIKAETGATIRQAHEMHAEEVANLKREHGKEVDRMRREHAENVNKQREHAKRGVLGRILTGLRLLSERDGLTPCLREDVPWMDHYRTNLRHMVDTLEGRDLQEARQRITRAIDFLAGRLIQLERDRTRNAQCLGRLAGDAVETCRKLRRIHLTVDKVTDDSGEVDETALKALNAALQSARQRLGNGLVLHTAESGMPPQMVLPQAEANWDVTAGGIQFVLSRHRQPYGRDSLRLTEIWAKHFERIVLNKKLTSLSLEKEGVASPA